MNTYKWVMLLVLETNNIHSISIKNNIYNIILNKFQL